MRKSKITDTKQKWAIFFCLPNILFFIVFFIVPATLGISYSLTNYNGLSRMDFVGLANYAKLFHDQEFYKVLLNTIKFTVVSVPIAYIVSMLLALLLSDTMVKGTTAMRIFIYWPTLLSTIMVGLTWKWLFGEDFGVVNYVLRLMHMQPIHWMTTSHFAFLTTISAYVWSGCGTNMLIFIGGIQQIPQSLHDAAKIDGASKWQDFIHITVPGLSAVSFMIIILTTISSFKVFAMVLTLTNGGPGTSTTYLIQYIYQKGFDKMQVGYSSAASMVMFFVLIVLSIFYTKYNTKKEMGN
ncbi:MAG: carbohydrate ABC transporter permease [Sphaerochaeta sp.]